MMSQMPEDTGPFIEGTYEKIKNDEKLSFLKDIAPDKLVSPLEGEPAPPISNVELSAMQKVSELQQKHSRHENREAAAFWLASLSGLGMLPMFYSPDLRIHAAATPSVLLSAAAWTYLSVEAGIGSDITKKLNAAKQNLEKLQPSQPSVNQSEKPKNKLAIEDEPSQATVSPFINPQQQAKQS
jgi:hypothetical protein